MTTEFRETISRSTMPCLRVFKLTLRMSLLIALLTVNPLLVTAEDTVNDSKDSFQRQFALNSIPTLVLEQIPGKVEIVASSSTAVNIVVTGTDAEKLVSLTQDGQTISIKGTGAAGGNTVTVNSSGGTVRVEASGTNNQIIINGKQISTKQATTPLSIRIETPPESQLTVRNVRELTTTLALGDATIRSTGKVTLDTVKSLRLFGSGTAKTIVNSASEINATLTGVSKLELLSFHGDQLNVTLNGSSSLKAAGEFGAVDIQASGASKVETTGLIQGDFNANARGASRIIHHGAVKGNISQNTSGASKIEVKG